MSVLIKGIEMPKRHLFEAFVAIGDGQIVVKDLEKNKLFEGKIEEVRTPHGRLIDGDALFDPMEEALYAGFGCDPTGIAAKVICEVPTIIEAEVSEK
jgi:hypothetical protein